MSTLIALDGLPASPAMARALEQIAPKRWYSDKYRIDMAAMLGCKPDEVEAKLDARAKAQAYIAERMDREGHPFPRSFGGSA